MTKEGTDRVEEWMENQISSWSDYRYLSPEEVKKRFDDNVPSHREAQWKGFTQGSKYSTGQIRKKWGKERADKHAGWAGYYHESRGQRKIGEFVSYFEDKNNEYREEMMELIKKSTDPPQIKRISLDTNKYHRTTIHDLEIEKSIRVKYINQQRSLAKSMFDEAVDAAVNRRDTSRIRDWYSQDFRDVYSSRQYHEYEIRLRKLMEIYG